MKKIIFSILALLLIALCIPDNVNAQSSETDLDQVELMKQFIGKWVRERGVDSTLVWEFVPWEKGYEVILSWQAKGEPYRTYKGIIGFSGGGDNTVISYHMKPNGSILKDFGKFESDGKIVYKRYNSSHSHVNGTLEYLFVSPDKFEMIYKSRGSKDTWDDASVMEWTFTRVK